MDSREINRSKGLLSAGTSLGFVVVRLNVTIVNVALHEIGASLGSGVSGFQWMVNAYTLVFAALTLTEGRWVIGLALGGFSSLVSRSSASVGSAVACRPV
jgi:MFS transporter, DHA2 family, methylenomycin A resistance protein